MGQTRGQLKATVRVNLDDAGITFFSENDLNDSFQDAYDDIVCLTQCIPQVADGLSWLANLCYYNPISDLGVTDYLGVIAIFNYSTNRWLRDDLTLRDFDRIQRNWENWQGTPQYWVSSDPLHFAIAPNYGSVPQGLFKLVYCATAPALIDDTSTFLIASDMQDLIEFYTTADMLEQAQEYNKALDYWEKYYEHIDVYATRVKKSNASDLLLRV
jgi:hypothetical protein